MQFLLPGLVNGNDRLQGLLRVREYLGFAVGQDNGPLLGNRLLGLQGELLDHGHVFPVGRHLGVGVRRVLGLAGKQQFRCLAGHGHGFAQVLFGRGSAVSRQPFLRGGAGFLVVELFGVVAPVFHERGLCILHGGLGRLLGKLVGVGLAALEPLLGLEIGQQPPAPGLGLFRGQALHLRAIRVGLQFFLLAPGRRRLALRDVRPLHGQPQPGVLFRVIALHPGAVQVIPGFHIRCP